jgi:hypothetical protein
MQRWFAGKLSAMRIRNAEVSAPGPRLPVALKEIAEKLTQDNWCRISTHDGKQTYYIVGCDEQSADIDGRAEFPRWDFPTPTQLGPLSESFSRSQVADKHRDYVKQAQSDLECVGVPQATIDRLAVLDLDSPMDWGLGAKIPRVERNRLLSNLFQALRVARTGAQECTLDDDESAEADIVREKLCLQEVAAKYLKIVDRWEQLEWLAFDDAQLQEACKAFLYGFYRASILLCASAVESQLKRISGSGKYGSELIKLVEQKGQLGRDQASHCRDLFRKRNASLMMVTTQLLMKPRRCLLWLGDS